MNRTRLIGLFLLLIAFTGCITIEENYTFKKNGSGTMEYVVDMSQIGEMLKAFEDMGDGKGKEDKDAGLNQLDMKEQVSALKNVPGIKKVKLNNKDKYVQRVSFAFADLNALNAALNVLMEDSTDTQHTFFQWEGNTLVRRSNGHARDIGLGMGNEDPSDTTDMTEFGNTPAMMRTAHINAIATFSSAFNPGNFCHSGVLGSEKKILAPVIRVQAAVMTTVNTPATATAPYHQARVLGRYG